MVIWRFLSYLNHAYGCTNVSSQYYFGNFHCIIQIMVLQDLGLKLVRCFNFRVSPRYAPMATDPNGNGRFNGIGTAVAPVSSVGSSGSRCSGR